MSFKSKSYFLFALTLGCFNTTFAMIPSPLSERDTTDRMNSGGDRVEHPGLRDEQPDPQYRDTWWGPRNWYYGENYRDSFRYWDPYRNNYYWGYDVYTPPGAAGNPSLDYNYSPGYYYENRLPPSVNYDNRLPPHEYNYDNRLRPY